MTDQNDMNEHESDDSANGLTDVLAESELTFVTEEKKPLSRGTIAVSGLILLSVVGLYFMYVRSGPQSAAAASAESTKAKQTIKQFLDSGPDNIKLMETMLRNTEKVVEQFLAYPSMKQVPLSDLRANPFRHVSLNAAADNTKEEAEKKRREEERLAVLKAVQVLRLQTIMHSDARKACMINNALYIEGQQIDQFTIEKINSDAVVVKSGSYRFELRMQR